MTKGINQTLDISLQIMLWQIIDDFKDTKEIELDYLQVFKIRRNKNQLIIEHTQEVPEYKKVYLFNNLGSLIEEDLKIFIIDENEYSILHSNEINSLDALNPDFLRDCINNRILVQKGTDETKVYLEFFDLLCTMKANIGKSFFKIFTTKLP